MKITYIDEMAYIKPEVLADMKVMPGWTKGTFVSISPGGGTCPKCGGKANVGSYSDPIHGAGEDFACLTCGYEIHVRKDR